MIAFLNGFELDLTDTKIALTKQVNDLANLSNRQSNFTNKMIFPKTAKNVLAFQYLSKVGNQSNVPYRKNEFDLIDNKSGKHLIYKGWLIVNQTTDKGFECTVYDGIIDFYKIIETKTLGVDLDLNEIDHEKNVTTVTDSFTAGLPYQYLIADYNGKTHHGGKVNIDYLPASAKVSYLWAKIFSTFGYTYSGSIFTDSRFTNLWLTYPKGVSEDVTLTDVLFSNDLETETKFLKIITYTILNDIFLTTTNKTEFLNLTTGTFNFQITCDFLFDIEHEIVDGLLIFVKNGIEKTVANLTSNLITVDFTETINENDIYYFYVKPLNYTGGFTQTSGSFIEINVKKYDTLVSFSTELNEFYIKDFFNEILSMFALTPFKDKYKNNIEFLTLNELIDTTTAIDWSDKFPKKTNENYKFGNYAKENIFSYQYNDDLSTYNNGSILIDNENLNDFQTVISSKTFSPSKDFVDFELGNTTIQSLIFKQYEKEIQDNNTIKYKALDKRFYFQRSENVLGIVNFTSEKLTQNATVNEVSVANFNQLDMDSIIGNNYLKLKEILNKSKVIECAVYLSSLDYESFDFKKLVYIKQFSSYFVVNKISNFKRYAPTKVELIKVK